MSRTSHSRDFSETGISTAKRFAWGGAGAMAPILASLVILDIDSLVHALREVSEDGGYLVLGYSIRILVLFLLGGVWASLDKLEVEPKKLFQLGIIAPAMITGMLNASALQKERIESHPEMQASAVHFNLLPISAAQADDKKSDSKKSGKTRSPSPLDQVIKGFLGR